MDPGVDQVRLEARAALAGVFTGLIEEGAAAGEFAPQDGRLRGAGSTSSTSIPPTTT